MDSPAARLVIRVQYFAILREERGRSEEEVETQSETVGALYDELRTRHRFTLPPERMKVVINDEFVDWTHPLSAGDCVIFIPPVAGGVGRIIDV